ncbi:hypothetical protein R3X27_24700 [Tropicimonas sp. TH_r6]|uniref:hypothetical protein n=1 Tax=Tropicimonas sp. TH_r6 TaxID=3082085 RepID=UPI002954A1D5|nr:hypothetical protein [Tropicimonas sp. TH_r6]MDV7145892.1 hypothetical protein [Tropicimonas sp. TH_r6]
MSTFPRSFLPENTYRLVHYSDPANERDSDRLLEVAANAITDARSAVQHFGDLPTMFTDTVRDLVISITASVGERDVHTECYREIAGQFVGAANHWLGMHNDDESLRSVIFYLERSRESSERIADFQAAKDVIDGRLRVHRNRNR